MRTKRVAILSQGEQRLIQIADNRKELLRAREKILSKPILSKQDKGTVRKINLELARISRRMTTLTRNLDRRLPALMDDLRIILNSKSLRSVVAIRSWYFDDITPLWQEIHRPVVGFNYGSWHVKQKVVARKSVYDRSEDTKKKVVLYWLDTKVTPEPTADDIFKPDYAIRGIKSKSWFKLASEKKSGHNVRERYDVRAILIEAVELEFRYYNQISEGYLHGILPKRESDAVDIYKIKNAISKLKDSVSDQYKSRGGL